MNSITVQPVSGIPAAALDSPLRITVLFTDVKHTLTALRSAANLACDLNATIRILYPYAVPYPLSVGHPPVGREFLARQVRTIANGCSIPTQIDVCLCRDAESIVLRLLEPHSIVVLGSKRKWARFLSRNGHYPITAGEPRENFVYSLVRRARRAAAVSVWPFSTAAWRGVFPWLLRRVGSAPLSSNSSTTSRRPHEAAL